MSLILRIVNLGIKPTTDEFKASRIRTFNRVLIIMVLTYISTIPIGFYLDSMVVVGILLFLLALLFPCFYLVHTGKIRLSKYLLTLNTWLLISSLCIYIGIDGGHVYTLISGAILWFIIYNKTWELLIVQGLNILVGIGILIYTYYIPPIWQGDITLLLPIKWSLIFLGIFVTIITIAFFKINNYNFVNIVRQQKRIMEERQDEIEASIRYAKNIQFGLLPEHKEIDEFCDQNFILFKPRDKVSGDMFWTGDSPDNKLKFLVLGDCTGHGVPGAMVSILGLSLLDSIMAEREIKTPSQLLAELDSQFSKRMAGSALNDGIDISVLMHNTETDEWVYCGGNNSIIVCSENDNHLIKGCKRAIGDQMMKHVDFYDTLLDVKPHDSIYLYSDGFRDQFGGAKHKKFGMKRFRELLSNVAPLKPTEQLLHINEVFNDWMKDIEQIDDIALIGIKIKAK